MYIVTKLSETADYLKKKALQSDENEVINSEPNTYYKELFDRISLGEGQAQQGWMYLFNNRELMMLAEYIYVGCNGQKERIDALMSVFEKSERFDYIEKMYCMWQKDFWKDEKYSGLFSVICNNHNLTEHFKGKYGIHPQPIADADTSDAMVLYYNEQAGQACDGSYSGYENMLKSFGLVEEGTLYRECIKRYMFICNGRAYMEMGVEKVTGFLAELDNDDKKLMIRNMLMVMDGFQLKCFVSVVPVFRNVIGNEGTEVYEKLVGSLPKQCQDRYLIMQNQYLIYDILGKNERSDFWMGYAEKGIVRVHESTKTLMMEFPTFTVIEFCHEEAAYFFNNEYMKEVVNHNMPAFETEKEMEQWLYNNTEWSSDKDHQDHWRKAHMGNWQLDMKSYMGHYLNRR
ncbi:MAG: hypothetical protein E7265_11755 [Lachnospiraceae bacterium]|nr:hypothetical protein [Lachnospiraceae bacterium]